MWLITLSLAPIQFPEVQLDEFSKNMAFFQEMLQKKVSLKKKSKRFRSKWCFNMLKKPFFFWQNVVFTDETRVRISSDGIVRIFRRNGTRFLEKNSKNLSSDKRSLMFWDAIRSDERKLLVKCPNKLNAVGCLEILKIYEEKMYFLDLIFQQDNAPVHKSKITAISSKKTSGRYWNGQHTVQI